MSDGISYDLPAAPFGEWVLAFWPHLYRLAGKVQSAGGWVASRRNERGWQAQVLTYRCYPLDKPVAWTTLLQPDATAYSEAIS